MNAIILVSGGMDSAVAAAIAMEKHPQVMFIHFNYGQLTEKKEEQCFHSLAEYYGIQHKQIISFDFLKQLGHSSLTDPAMAIPKNTLHAHEIPSTYVPFRNGIFLSYSVALAEVMQATHIYIAAVETDSSGYPDCRAEFYQAFNQALRVGTVQGNLTIETPLVQLSKKEIVEWGIRLRVPFKLTWSCYQNEDQPCGQCDSCLLRKRGFELAGISDPLL